ncbi:E3 ubiquitin-protein ligase BIG BROTHER [Linum perenne]
MHVVESSSPTLSSNTPSYSCLLSLIIPCGLQELLDLGEAVGTESRGLSEELISMLPTSKCKFGSFFSRKKSGESLYRCVICQMRYKRGEKQTKLPCKHTYHSECITKWLVINKVPSNFPIL